MSFGAFAPFPLRLGGDAKRGFSAAQHARMCADMVAAVMTAPLAIIVFTTGTADSAVAYLGQHGIGLANAPTVAANGSVTWSASYEDDFDSAEPIKIHGAIGCCLSGATKVFPVVEVEANNQIRVRTFDHLGAPANALVALVVF